MFLFIPHRAALDRYSVIVEPVKGKRAYDNVAGNLDGFGSGFIDPAKFPIAEKNLLFQFRDLFHGRRRAPLPREVLHYKVFDGALC